MTRNKNIVGYLEPPPFFFFFLNLKLARVNLRLLCLFLNSMCDHLPKLTRVVNLHLPVSVQDRSFDTNGRSLGGGSIQLQLLSRVTWISCNLVQSLDNSLCIPYTSGEPWPEPTLAGRGSSNKSRALFSVQCYSRFKQVAGTVFCSMLFEIQTRRRLKKKRKKKKLFIVTKHNT